ncbi:hypothetical protein DFO66_103315 [Brevibacterium sanguinis]|uniref:Uncharacterized protein n=2 Tax=Brevibacterium TaxID=1696 RepID=A0A366INU6_9MICO|nr:MULTISPECIES: hypothetical protein [Brevibacterium]RBP66368.1 hypothetical protein DFO66_103315 [Brevibacterium sanguinis]RBP73019.1 hypothetical protein DFO65_103314 [Brevibacterium celere]
MTLAPNEEVVDAEIVPTKMEAVASIERAIEHAEGFWREILWQVQNRIWEQLGYDSFDALWEHRYSRLGVRISRDERPELVAALRSIGQTQQEIAEKVGVHVNTVANDISTHKIVGSESITNSRGQARPASYSTEPKSEPDPPPNVDPDTGEIKDSPSPRDSMAVALINDLRGPWRRGITSTARKMTATERRLIIDALENTLKELKEIQS